MKNIVVVGGGPAGSVVSTLLAKAGFSVTLFDEAQRPELVVGESLVPATIPILKMLGVEEEVKGFSTYKPGATFYVRPEEPLNILFDQTAPQQPDSLSLAGTFRSATSKLLGKISNGTALSRTLMGDDLTQACHYSYNVPRKDFDELLRRTAKNAGAHLVEERAELEFNKAEDRVTLSPTSRSLLTAEPDLYIDASGRNRLIARGLDITSARGSRNDCVIFAHLDSCQVEHPGHIHINRLSRGWSWRIPLPGRVSVGVVMEASNWRGYGSSVEQRFDNILSQEPILSALTANSQRITPVATYSNYQLLNSRFFGENWVLVGDSAGFIDPIFSSGLNLALNGAVRTANAVIQNQRRGTTDAFLRYAALQRRDIASWQLVVNSFYDGSLFGLIRAGSLMRSKRGWNRLVPVVEQRIARTIAGMVPFDSWQFRFCKLMLASGVASRFGHRLAVR